MFHVYIGKTTHGFPGEDFLSQNKKTYKKQKPKKGEVALVEAEKKRCLRDSQLKNFTNPFVRKIGKGED